ncbi:hypothetical protein OAO87_01245 [bacterium]|nr:hypothetical protein [bacterium]
MFVATGNCKKKMRNAYSKLMEKERYDLKKLCAEMHANPHKHKVGKCMTEAEAFALAAIKNAQHALDDGTTVSGFEWPPLYPRAEHLSARSKEEKQEELLLAAKMVREAAPSTQLALIFSNSLESIALQTWELKINLVSYVAVKGKSARTERKEKERSKQRARRAL